MKSVAALVTVIRRACRRAARVVARHLSFFVLVLVMVVATACAATGIQGVLRGQTKEEVLSILGPPTAIKPPLVPLFGPEIWSWRFPPEGVLEKLRVVFWNTDGRVTGAHDFVPKPQPSPPVPKEK